MNEDLGWIDVHVGQRLKNRRRLLGLSQEALGRQLGLTFQQIQKYERGMTRVSASRLLQLSIILEVPISYFFEGIPNAPTESGTMSPEDGRRQRDLLELTRAYQAIPDKSLRQRLLELCKAMADREPKIGASA